MCPVCTAGPDTTSRPGRADAKLLFQLVCGCCEGQPRGSARACGWVGKGVFHVWREPSVKRKQWNRLQSTWSYALKTRRNVCNGGRSSAATCGVFASSLPRFRLPQAPIHQRRRRHKDDSGCVASLWNRLTVSVKKRAGLFSSAPATTAGGFYGSRCDEIQCNLWEEEQIARTIKE